MAVFSKIWQLVSTGVMQGIDLSASGNALHVDSLQVGSTSPEVLTKTILGRLISLQNGSDVAATYHTHDGRYYTEAELGATSGTTGSDLIGAPSTATNYTPADTTVQGHLEGIDAALATAGSTEYSDATFRIFDDGDNTKEIAFQASGVGSGATRTITMPDANVDLGNLTNSNISASAAISLAKLAALTANRALQSDGSGVISASAVTDTELGYVSGVTSSIQTQIGGKVSKSGDTMSGNLNMGTNKVTNLGTPTAANDATTKSYVDGLVSGLDFQPDVNDYVADASTTSPGTGLPAAATGQRYILASGTGSLETAWGTITGVGDNDIVEYNGSAWFVAYDVSVAGEGALVWNRADNYFMRYDGTDWAEFGGLSGITAGVGLSKTGNTLNVNLGAGIVELPSDEVGIDLYSASGLFLTQDGTTTSTDTAAQLSVRLDGSTIARSASGIKVSDAGITSTQLGTDSVITAKIQDSAVTTGKINDSAVTTAKINDAAVTDTKLATNAVTTAKILNQAVTADKLDAGVAGNGLTGGAGTALAVGAGSGIAVDSNSVSVEYAPVLQTPGVAGEGMAANTTFVVRYAVNGETAERLYKTDQDATSVSNFYAVGVAFSTSAASAGDPVSLIAMGLYTLKSNDSTFAGTDIGKPVFLTASGAFSVTAPTTASYAVTRIGVVVATNKMWIQPQVVGIN